MNRGRGLCMLGSAMVVLTAGALPAQADLYKGVARGLALFDFRFSGERNVLGDGITVNANAVYNNRDFHLGLADLTLNGVVSMSGGYTKRGIPGAFFSLNTGGAPLAYQFETRNGIANITATGSVLIDVDTSINALGFYDTTLLISNRGTYQTDALVGEQQGTLDFDIGPIQVTSGNIYADVLAALTQPFFEAAGTENPFAKFGQAAKLASATSTVEELQARLAAGETLTDQEMSTLINNSIIAAVLGGNKLSGNLFSNLMVPDGLLQGKDSVANAKIVPVPEPVTLAPLILAMGLWIRPRRRQGR